LHAEVEAVTWLLAGYGNGGAVYLTLGGIGIVSDTNVTLNGCSMYGNSVAYGGFRDTCRVPLYTSVLDPSEKSVCTHSKAWRSRKRVAAASSPAATCKQGAALTSPARHACGYARPSRARFGHRDSKTLSDGSKT
jgi:hypothetical protein